MASLREEYCFFRLLEVKVYLLEKSEPLNFGDVLFEAATRAASSTKSKSLMSTLRIFTSAFMQARSRSRS